MANIDRYIEDLDTRVKNNQALGKRIKYGYQYFRVGLWLVVNHMNVMIGLLVDGLKTIEPMQYGQGAELPEEPEETDTSIKITSTHTTILKHLLWIPNNFLCFIITMSLFRTGKLGSFILQHNLAFCVGLAALFGAVVEGYEGTYYRQQDRYCNFERRNSNNKAYSYYNTLVRQTIMGALNATVLGTAAYFSFDFILKKMLKTSLSKEWAITCAVLIGCTAAKLVDLLEDIFMAKTIIKLEDRILDGVDEGLRFVSRGHFSI